jgi:hypothetical protein
MDKARGANRGGFLTFPNFPHFLEESRGGVVSERLASDT